MGGSTVRQNCKWIKLVRDENESTGSVFVESDQPDLLRALRAISDYEKWVGDRLMPIANKWIQENRERIIEGMSAEEMNDMGAAIEKAYQLIEEEGYIAERTSARESFDLDTAQINPLWKEKTKQFIECENKVKGEKGPNRDRELLK